MNKLYKVKWDANTKLWYIGEMVEGLRPYAIMKIQVDYDDKDLCKSKYKSMRKGEKILSLRMEDIIMPL